MFIMYVQVKFTYSLAIADKQQIGFRTPCIFCLHCDTGTETRPTINCVVLSVLMNRILTAGTEEAAMHPRV